MTKLYNKASETKKRKILRSAMPLAEKVVWAKLRSRQVENCKFRRQFSIGAFVIDFYAPELKLAIEIDGDSHYQASAMAYDQERQSFLEHKGTTVLRFTNQEVYEELDAVLVRISDVIRTLRK